VIAPLVLAAVTALAIGYLIGARAAVRAAHFSRSRMTHELSARRAPALPRPHRHRATVEAGW
jgi:hypothetical protein